MCPLLTDAHQFLGGVQYLLNLQKSLEEMGAEVFLHAQVEEGEEVFLQTQVGEREEVEEWGAEVFLQAPVGGGISGFPSSPINWLSKSCCWA